MNSKDFIRIMQVLGFEISGEMKREKKKCYYDIPKVNSKDFIRIM